MGDINLRKIILTGATSSLGTAVIEECKKQGIQVLAVVQKDSRNRNRIQENELIKIVECNLDEYVNYGLNMEIRDSYDAFIHLAWGSTQGDSARGELMPQVLNIQYSLDAVNVAERFGCKVFVGAGSQAEYGKTDETLTEETKCKPETPYGIAKLCAGQLTGIACHKKEIRHIWPRILSAYGPNCQPQTVLNYTITELLKGRKPSLSAGEQIWDFIYTGDVARALLLLAEKGHDGEVYVVGSGESKPLKEYLLKARDIVAPGKELGFGEKPYTENTVMHLSCDTGKLKRDTGFETEVSFEEGIRNTVTWIKERGIV